MVTNIHDMIQDEHDDVSGAKRILMYGTKTDSTTQALLLNDDGTVKLSKLDYVGSPMIVSGGEISEGTASETYDVAPLTALLRTTTDSTGTLKYVEFAGEDNRTIPSADTKYKIHLKYNSGTPILTTSTSGANGTTDIGIGSVMKGTDSSVHFMNAGMRLQNGVAKLSKRATTLREIELGTGCKASESGGTRTLDITSGIIYEGINRVSFSNFDTNEGDTFTTLYNDGNWVKTTGSTQVDNTQYNNYGIGLTNLTTNQYGIFWVYIHPDDQHVYLVYGIKSYKLAEAEVATLPSDLPVLVDFGCLIGKIIIKKNADTFIFQGVNDTFFVGTAVIDHGELIGLTDDDHPQYLKTSSAALDVLTDVSLGTPSNDDVLTYDSASSMWTSSAQAAGTASDHSALANLNWASAGHTIDTNVDFNDNQAIDFVHETVSSLPAVVVSKVVYLSTDNHLYLGVN